MAQNIPARPPVRKGRIGLDGPHGLRYLHCMNSKWRVRRTREEQPCEQYEVVRSIGGGAVETYKFADTRQDAEALCREAQESRP